MMNESGKPTLVEIIRTLEAVVSSVPLAEIPSLLGTLEKIKAVGWGRMVTGPQLEHAAGDLLTVPETAARLKLSPYRVYELIRQGKLKRVPIGKAVRVKCSDLDEFLATQGP